MEKQTKAKKATLSKLRKYERRYHQILDAAAAVFADKGYHGTTTQNIADKLGIRQASLYYYASGKEELLEAVCGVGIQGFLESAEHISKSDQSAQDKIRSVIIEHLKPLSKKPDYMHVFLNCRKHLPKSSRHKIDLLAELYEDLIENIFKDGVISGEFRNDLDCRLATLALLAICNSAPFWFNREKTPGLKKSAQQFANLILSGTTADRSISV